MRGECGAGTTIPLQNEIDGKNPKILFLTAYSAKKDIPGKSYWKYFDDPAFFLTDIIYPFPL
ncbi:MAG: hypothetical protein GX880_10380 [Methanomicrobiales archaeon]|nr:hypothetical protein [Methanomicrobiales archaeon]